MQVFILMDSYKITKKTMAILAAFVHGYKFKIIEVDRIKHFTGSP